MVTLIWVYFPPSCISIMGWAKLKYLWPSYHHCQMEMVYDSAMCFPYSIFVIWSFSTPGSQQAQQRFPSPLLLLPLPAGRSWCSLQSDRTCNTSSISKAFPRMLRKPAERSVQGASWSDTWTTYTGSCQCKGYFWSEIQMSELLTLTPAAT